MIINRNAFFWYLYLKQVGFHIQYQFFKHILFQSPKMDSQMASQLDQDMKKLLELNDKLVKQKKFILAKDDKIKFLMGSYIEKLENYLEKIDRIIQKGKVVKNQNNQLIDYQKKLQVVRSQIRKLQQQRDRQNQPQSWYMSVWQSIKNWFWNIISALKSVLRFLLKAFDINTAWLQETIEITIETKISKQNAKKDILQFNIISLRRSNQLHLIDIKQFIQNQLPQIQQFFKEFQRIFPHVIY